MKKMSAAHLAEKIAQHSEADPADFSNADLRERDLSRSVLPGADFTNANARGCDLSGCDLRGTNWTDANLRFADFSGADLSASVLDYADMTGANMSEAKLAGASMVGTTLPGTSRASTTGRGDEGLDGFPKIWSYTGNGSTGLPFMTAPGVFDMTMVNAMAKRHLITAQTVPWSNAGQPANQNLVALLRPLTTSKILLYDSFQQRFLHISQTQYGEEWTLVKGAPDRSLFYDGTHGPNFPAGPFGVAYPYGDPNLVWWDMGDGGGAYAPAGLSLANIWKAHNVADGYFFDFFYGKPANNTVDPAHAPMNYASVAALNAKCDSETAVCLTALRPQMMYGNRGGSPALTSDATTHLMNGELYERWDPDLGLNGPNIPGGGGFGAGAPATFDAVMSYILAQWPSGALVKGETGESGTTPAIIPGVARWNKLMRYCLGSAAMLGGYCFIDQTDREPAPMLWWADEYSVNLNGTADTTQTRRSWLGTPLEAARNVSTGCWVRRFTNGIVAVNGDGTTAHDIDLGKQYRRITGAQDAAYNNGAIEQVTNIPGKNARFFVNYP